MEKRKEDVIVNTSLAKRTRRYWQASLAWNEKREIELSLYEQNALLKKALVNSKPTERLTYVVPELVDKLISYGFKPRNGLKRYRTKIHKLKG